MKYSGEKKKKKNFIKPQYNNSLNTQHCGRFTCQKRQMSPGGHLKREMWYTLVNGSGLGVQDGKASGYFLTSVTSGYFRFISGYVLTSDVGSWSSGPETSVSSLKFLQVFLFPVGILLPVWILFPVLRSYLDLTALMTGLPWRRTVPQQDGSRRVSDRFPGALAWNPTCRTD